MFNSKRSDTTLTRLYNQDSFDDAFLKDISSCQNSLVIESPFIRLNRVLSLVPALTKLRKRGVHIIINTRNPVEHDSEYHEQAEYAVGMMQDRGVRVLYTVKHHRKLAIIDRSTFWEGSLNILSYYDSCEIMRRTVSPTEAEILINFIGMQKYLQEN